MVDELHVTFKHTQEMPWILPGIPPTNKRVEVAVVSIVTLRGGRLYHEHVYWDQASVLLQVGLLDPKAVPEKAKMKGVKTLPVVGREAARRLVRGFEDDEGDEGEADNELLPGWYDDEEEDADDVHDDRSTETQKTNGKKMNGQSEEESGSSKNIKGPDEEEASQPEPQTTNRDGDEKDEEDERQAESRVAT
ncbi:hypothetical protein ONZ43_g5695 [Nemania bipapillata]|uniref:Uncharacterized protein n=1 Tax=Nemania bipapillata TaxID=110536 RepID=A0ACC2I7M6_9PEZI|nr:hypothetical protein ONZ43_g5695 [Nemania bipapillata]